MTNQAIERVLNLFELNEKQRTAVLERGRDVVVTAGAGSGKTTTLVVRYACLMAEGVPPRRMAAITFTRQAAREMRSRVRESLVKLQQASQTEEERQKWIEYSAQMDSARIGTIHSLCTEILHAHPAEASVDPRFQVLDENVSAALRIQAVEDSLKGLVEDGKFLPLLKVISTNDLSKMLQDLLNRRLEAGELFKKAEGTRIRITQQFRERMDDPHLRALITLIRGFCESEEIQAAGSGLFNELKEILRLWDAAETAFAKNNPINGVVSINQALLFMRNRSPIKMDETIKATLIELRNNLDSMIKQLGWEKALENAISSDNEIFADSILPQLQAAFNFVSQKYMELMETRHALDFDDLEFGAQKLLRREKIREYWQGELDAVLVDEFQDTNQRQREIAEALAGNQGHLFIVGDIRQSIYRFRNADVTVFKQVQDQVNNNSGLLVDLDMTYRAHEPLLQATGDLLSKVIGTKEDPNCSYYVPYTPMIAYKKNPPERMLAPHLEFVLGVGENAETGRAVTARALAERLLQLKQEEQILKWDEVALLFRASTGFPSYEEALEEAGIPFVTVAGRGFYDRPEIRDVVNILRAVADPMDDLSFAGLLRSPAFGLSDVALFQLHQTGQPFWNALQGDIQFLDERDQQGAVRARQILASILPQVDRVPVAELLKQVLDEVDYRAILATADVKTNERDASAAGGRLWRNLDKLLEDALVSSQTTVRDFLDLAKTMNDAGTREGEAPAEALGSVRLMTIHKAKGLEFPVVILADATRDVRSTSKQVYLSNDLGVTIKLDPPSMLYNMAKYLDDDQDGMERLRVLYVALTRAKTKLLVSGHVTRGAKGQLNMRGWTEELVIAAGIKTNELLENHGNPFIFQGTSNQPIRVWCQLDALPAPTILTPSTGHEGLVKSDLPPLYPPVEGFGQTEPEEKDDQIEEQESWHAIHTDKRDSSQVLGKIVHKAIQRWLFPGDHQLTALLEMETFNAGLASEKLRLEMINRSTELLARIRKHPLWDEINAATERYAELPYTYRINDRVENRVIDLLYLDSNGWKILDFKTDPILTTTHENELVQVYSPQVRRYAAVVESKLGQQVQARICFLDDQGNVELVEV